MTTLAASRLTSHSQGPGSVSSKSLASKTSARSGEAKSPKLLRWASPLAWTTMPVRGWSRGRTPSQPGSRGSRRTPIQPSARGGREQVLQPVLLLGSQDRDRVAAGGGFEGSVAHAWDTLASRPARRTPLARRTQGRAVQTPSVERSACRSASNPAAGSRSGVALGDRRTVFVGSVMGMPSDQRQGTDHDHFRGSRGPGHPPVRRTRQRRQPYCRRRGLVDGLRPRDRPPMGRMWAAARVAYGAIVQVAMPSADL